MDQVFEKSLTVVAEPLPKFSEFLRAFYALTKPTITLLVVVTVVPGFLLSNSAPPTWSVIVATLLGTALSSASAAVFNQIIDARIDSNMERTKKRPLPIGMITPLVACFYGLILGILGASILCAFAGPLAAGIAVGANFFYVFIYTVLLKRSTSQNIVIGGAAGAVGPLIGCAAATGDLSVGAWLLFAVIFLWTPPHFWALALKYRDDYARAGIPMLPVVKGNAATRTQIFIYTWTLFPVFLGLYYTDYMTAWGLILCLLFSGYFTWLAGRLWWTQDQKRAMPVFIYSCGYLFAIFTVVSIDRLCILFSL